MGLQRRVRLAIFGQSPCNQCIAACCKQNGHEFAVLLVGAERRKFAAYALQIVVEGSDGRRTEAVLPYQDGKCGFLDSDDRCLNYDDRPTNCRRFQCVTSFALDGPRDGVQGDFLRRNPHVLQLLQTF